MFNQLSKVLIIGLLVNQWSITAYSKKTLKRQVATELSVTIEDIVHKVEKIEDGHRVLFKKHSGMYYLKSSSENYEIILEALKTSKRKNGKISLKADGNTLEVLSLTIDTKN